MREIYNTDNLLQNLPETARTHLDYLDTSTKFRNFYQLALCLTPAIISIMASCGTSDDYDINDASPPPDNRIILEELNLISAYLIPDSSSTINYRIYLCSPSDLSVCIDFTDSINNCISQGVFSSDDLKLNKIYDETGSNKFNIYFNASESSYSIDKDKKALVLSLDTSLNILSLFSTCALPLNIEERHLNCEESNSSLNGSLNPTELKYCCHAALNGIGGDIDACKEPYLYTNMSFQSLAPGLITQYILNKVETNELLEDELQGACFYTNQATELVYDYELASHMYGGDFPTQPDINNLWNSTNSYVQWFLDSYCSVFNFPPTWDQDLDGFGVDTGVPSSDCNDADAAINPGNLEREDDTVNLCNNKKDDDCDGVVDGSTFYVDKDGDKSGDNSSGIILCPNFTTPEYTLISDYSMVSEITYQGSPYINVSGDCDDNNTTVYPSYPEICNGIDDNCDGEIDLSCGSENDYDLDGLTTTDCAPHYAPWSIWGYYDMDEDGFGTGISYCAMSPLPSNMSSISGDCNDMDSMINPGSLERCHNWTDDDCDEATDEAECQ